MVLCVLLTDTLMGKIIRKRKNYLYYSELDPVKNSLSLGQNTRCCFESAYCVQTTGLVMRRVLDHQPAKFICMLHPVMAQKDTQGNSLSVTTV